MALKKGEMIYPGVEDSVALEQAKGTISGLVDAIVELITNSDDSYSNLEHEGLNLSGIIKICIKRAKGQTLKELKVIDEAAGMTSQKIENIICYGKRTSAVFEGRDVRGFFGRGLKESIIALGTGTILSVARGEKTYGKYYYDFDKEKLVWVTIDEGSKSKKSSGSEITIFPLDNQPIRCPSFDTLFKQISNHYALREILSSVNRKVILTVEKFGLKKQENTQTKRLKFIPPIGNMIENKNIYLNGFGIGHLKLYESHERLPYSRNDPGSLAGIVIKTSNSLLENQLFGFDNNPNAHYFFGEFSCPGILKKMRAGEKGFVKSDRSGIYWKHEYSAEIEMEIKNILSHHISRKKKQAESQQIQKKMPAHRAEKFGKIFKKLNSLGRRLLPEVGPGPDIQPDSLDIKHLTIYPPEAIAPPDQFRSFSIYTLYESIKNSPNAKIFLDDSKGKFILSNDKVELKKHSKREDLAIGYFKIKGFRHQDKTGIIVKQGLDEDLAEFAIGVQREKKKPKGTEPPKKRKGGLFKEVIFDTFDAKPPQRVYYDRNTGELRIYINYPGILPYLGANGAGCESERGSLLISELMAEAFCRETARRKVERDFYDGGAQLEQYIKMYNEHLKLCIPIIHNIWIT